MRYYLEYLNNRLDPKQNSLCVSDIEKMAGTVAELLNAECKYRLLMFIDVECYDCVCITDSACRFQIVRMSCFKNGLDSVLESYKEDIQNYELAYFQNQGLIEYDAYYDSQFPELQTYKSSIQKAIEDISLPDNPEIPVYVSGGNTNLLSVRYAIQKKLGRAANKVKVNNKINLKSKIHFSHDTITKVLHLSIPGISVSQVIKQKFIEVFLPDDDLSKSSSFIDGVIWSDLVSPEFEKCRVGNTECIYLKISFEIDAFNNLICKTEDTSRQHRHNKLLIEAPFGRPTECFVKQKPLVGSQTLERAASDYDITETQTDAKLKSASKEVSNDVQASIHPTTSISETFTEVSSEYDLKPNKFKIQAGECRTYEEIFGEYLRGAEEIVVTDPYIRLWYQFENFKELIMTCEIVNKEESTKLKKIHLITKLPDKPQIDSKTKEKIDAQKAAEDNKKKLEDLTKELLKAKYVFTYEFRPGIHDRSILLSNGWYISLGRGLDMFEKRENKFVPRKCKETIIEIYRASDIKTVKPKKRNVKQ